MLDQAMAAAANAGLALGLASRPSPTGELFVVTVERSPMAGSWSLEPTEIAVAKDPDEAARRAMAAIAKMLPRLQKHLATVPDEPETLALSAGVSSEGVVSTLRVERDGTVRLAREDIEAIAEAVYRRMRPRVKISNGP